MLAIDRHTKDDTVELGKRKLKFTRRDTIGRRGEQEFALFVDKELGWIFRRIDEPDVGIDGEIEIVQRGGHAVAKISEGNTTGRLLKVQIKTTEGNLRNKKSFNVYFDKPHLDYWNSIRIPVLLIAVSLEGGIWWQHIDPRANYETDRGAWKVDFDYSNELATYSKQLIMRLTDSRQLQDAQIALTKADRLFEKWEQRFDRREFDDFDDARRDLEEALQQLESAKTLLESDRNADGWAPIRERLRRFTNRFESLSSDARFQMFIASDHRDLKFPELRHNFRSGILSRPED